MNFYPPELTTPPLPLVALLGRQDMHATVRDFLRTQQKPPVNTIGAADPAHASRLFGERKSHSAALPTCDFFKSNWFAKHRQRCPAVAVVLLDRDWVVGDPNSWTRACEQLDWVRTATRPRGVRMIVAIVQNTGSATEVPEDRGLVLRRRADVDARSLMVISREDGDASLRKLGKVILEQAGQFYSEEVKRVLNKAADRAKIATTPVYSYNLRACFKAAAFSEFRQDWGNALKHYQAAYAHCQEAAGSYLDDGINVVQRYAEICSVAEQLHIKITALLLHQQRVAEALTHFERHMSTFKAAAAKHALPAAAAAAHWDWVCRQYSVAGQLLAERVETSLLPDTRAAQPAYFFQCGANAVMMRRAAVEMIEEEGAAVDCVPGPFVGQLVAAAGGVGLTDPQYVAFLTREERKVNFSKEAIDLLNRAHEGYKQHTVKKGASEVPRAPRTIYHIAGLMAAEYLTVGEAGSAKRLLDSVASVYRRERWHRPLAATLSLLRSCAEQLGEDTSHVEYSLELAALEGSGLNYGERYDIAEAALASLAGASAAGGGAGVILPVAAGSGLSNVIHLAAGFPAGDEYSDAPTDGAQSVFFGVALRYCLPPAMPGVRVEVTFRDAEGALQTVPAEWEAGEGEVGVLSSGGGWARCWAPCQLQRGVQVTAASVALHLGSAGTSLLWELTSVDGAPIAHEPTQQGHHSTELPFGTSLADMSGRAVEPGNYKMRLGLVTAVPVLSIGAPPSCLVGEDFPLEVTVRTDGAALSGATLLFDVQSNGPDDSECPALLSDQVPPGVVALGAEGAPLGRGSRVTGPLVLPTVERGRPLTVTFRMPARQVGIVSVSATVSAPAGKNEAPSASASVDVKMEVPFQLTHCLRAPHHSHVLLPATAKGENALGTVSVPCGQPFLLSASLHAAARSPVRLLRLELVLPKDTSLKVEASCGMVDGAKHEAAVMQKGDVHSSIFQLLPMQAAAQARLGVLRVTWQRLAPVTLQADDSASQTAEGVVTGLEALSLQDGAPAGKTRAGGMTEGPAGITISAKDGSKPSQPVDAPSEASSLEEVCTDIALPDVVVQEPLLLAATRAPPSTVAGSPFCYALEMTNPTSVLQEVYITVGDTSGFVFADERQASVSLLPGQDVRVAWTVVAYNAGLMPLPDLQVASARYSARMKMTSSNKVFVMPREVSNVQTATVAS